MKRATILLALTCALIAGAATTTKYVSGSGGTLVSPTKVGQNITATGIHLTNGGTASLTCPVTSFGVGPYQWNWECRNGKLLTNGYFQASVSGTMKLNCYGGGRYRPTTCWHNFSGTTTAGAVTGTIKLVAKGGINNAPASVTSFSASW